MNSYAIRNKQTLDLLKLCCNNIDIHDEEYMINLDIDLSSYIKRIKKYFTSNNMNLNIEEILLEDLYEISLIDNRAETLEEYLNFLDTYIDIHMISDIAYLRYKNAHYFVGIDFRGRKICIDIDEKLKVNDEIWVFSEHTINGIYNKDRGIFFRKVNGLLEIEKEYNLIKVLERVLWDRKSYDYVYISNNSNLGFRGCYEKLKRLKVFDNSDIIRLGRICSKRRTRASASYLGRFNYIIYHNKINGVRLCEKLLKIEYLNIEDIIMFIYGLGKYMEEHRLFENEQLNLEDKLVSILEKTRLKKRLNGIDDFMSYNNYLGDGEIDIENYFKNIEKIVKESNDW